MTTAELVASLAECTGIDPDGWNDVLSLPLKEVAPGQYEPGPEMLQVLKTYQELDWATHGPSLAQVVAILGAIAAIATPVATIAGAVVGAAAAAGAIKALLSGS